RSRKILAHYSSCGQEQRIFFIDRVPARPPFRHVEMRFAIVGIELPIHEKARRSGVVERRTRPEDSHLLVHPLVGDAVVVRDSAARGDSQLLQNVACVLEWKVRPTAEPVSQLDDDIGVAPGIAWWIDALLPVNHAAFRTATEAVFFLMQTTRQNDVGMMGGFRKKKINHAEELQLRQRLAGKVRVWQ